MDKRDMSKTIADMVVEAMTAGLNGEKLPDFGPLPAFQIGLVNSIYDAARNRRAGDRVIAKRVR